MPWRRAVLAALLGGLATIHPAAPVDPPRVALDTAQASAERPKRGGVHGTWPHGLMTGQLQLAAPIDDVRHLAALCDSEVHWVDRWLGALLAGFDEATRARGAAAMERDRWPAMQGPRLLLWQPVRPPAAGIEADAEARKRLQALGYAG